MSAKDILDKLEWYQRQFEAIRRDGNLSEAGKERQTANLRQSYELYADTVYREFATAWSSLRSKYAKLGEERRVAAQAESDTWNFEKLAYYRQIATGAINRTYSLDEAEKLIRGVMDTGSREQRRAYLESSVAVMARYGSILGVGGFAEWMDSEAAKLTRPPEFDALDEQEQKLRLQAVKLQDDTITAANMYPSSNVSGLLRGVHIGGKVDAITGEFSYVVNFSEPEPTAQAAPVVAPVAS